MTKPVINSAVSDNAAEVAAANLVTFNGDISLNRAGDFKLRFKFFDELGGKDLTFEVPLKVAE